MTIRVAVLASGSGSNLQAILDHLDAVGETAARVALVGSDRGDARALDRARRHGVEALVLDESTRTAGLHRLLDDRGIDVVALAGYMRFVPDEVVRRWRGRIVNVHPSLLPAFGGTGMYGARVHRAVHASGVRLTGVTVHFVDEEYDHGPVIAQWPVPVFADGTPESIGARVLRVEHQLYPRIVRGVATGRITLGADSRPRGALDTAVATPFLPEDDSSLGAAIEALLSMATASRSALPSR